MFKIKNCFLYQNKISNRSSSTSTEIFFSARLRTSNIFYCFYYLIFLSPLLSLDRVRGPKVAETGSGVTESGLIDAAQVLRPIRPDREAGRNPGRLRSRGPGLKKQR